MTLLTSSDIQAALVSAEPALKILPFQQDLLRPTCYHFQLGPRFVKRLANGTSERGEISDQNPTLRISPGEYVVAESFEQFVLPPDVIAIMGPSRDMIRNGLVMNHNGYVNPPCLRSLEFGLSNCTGQDVHLQFTQRIGRISFLKFTGAKNAPALETDTDSPRFSIPLRDDDPVHPQDPIDDDEP